MQGAGTLDDAVWADHQGIRTRTASEVRLHQRLALSRMDVNIAPPSTSTAYARTAIASPRDRPRNYSRIATPRPSNASRLLVFLQSISWAISISRSTPAKGDKGGNDVRRPNTAMRQPAQPPFVWDGYLAERDLDRRSLVRLYYSLAQRKRVAAGNVLDWSH